MRELHETGGPAHPVAARPGVGLESLVAWRVEADAGENQARWAVPTDAAPGVLGHRIQPGDHLEWAWCPDETRMSDALGPLNRAELEHFWDATAFAIDLVLDSGERVSASAADQYGVTVQPEAQAAARMQWVNQWNFRRVNLDAYAGREVVGVEAVLGRPGRDSRLPLSGWLDCVRVDPVDDRAQEPLDFVSTIRGTHSSGEFSRGNNAPLVGLPHGGVFGMPMTRASETRWPYSYHEHRRASDNRPVIEAFATSHIPSPWMGDRGVFQVMPSPSATPNIDRTARALAFDRATEKPGPHRYAVRLEGGVDALLTAGEFALGMRFTFDSARSDNARCDPASDRPTASIIVDHRGSVDEVNVTENGGVIELVLDDRENTPPHFVRVEIPRAVGDHTEFTNGELRGFIQVDAAEPVDVLMGLSTVSFEDARANLRSSGGVDEMLASAESAWRSALDAITVEGATSEQLRSIYSSLYRVRLYPNRAGETARDGLPRHRSFYGSVLTRRIREGGDEVIESAASTTNGFWDTYRTAWPLLALLAPTDAAELATGFALHKIDGGWTPRWSAPGAEDVMTGTTSDTVFGDLAAGGFANEAFDLALAYRTAVRNATVPAPDTRVGRKGQQPAIFRGFVDTRTHEGMSWTLDAAINDWGTARMAAALAERAAPASAERERLEAEHEWFARRSLRYRNVFDRGRGFFIGRAESGEWRGEFEPDEWGFDYTETNAWGTAFTAPHDGAGLVALHGGHEAFMRRFREALSRGETGSAEVQGSYGQVIHEMTEARDVRLGMVGMSNQPAHHIPFMPMFAGGHDESHALVRDILTRLFVGSDIGQGYPGDEDNGEMSAWYLFAALGLYPLVPASGSYVLVPPSVRRSVLRVAGGETEIVVTSASMGPYVRSVTVNGKPWNDIAIPRASVAGGARIEFQLSDEPCGWAANTTPPSAPELHGFLDDAVDVLSNLASQPVQSADDADQKRALRNAAALTDDAGETVVTLGAGESVEIPAECGAVSLYTVTVDQPGEFGWRLDAVARDGAVTALDARSAEAFDSPRQTRVFRVRGSVAGRIRFTAVTDIALTQLELIAESARANRCRTD